MARVINETLNKIPVGATFQHRFDIRDGDGDLISDPTVAVNIVYPDASESDHTVGDGTLTAVAPSGTYDIDRLFSTIGDHFVTIKPSSGAWYVYYIPVKE